MGYLFARHLKSRWLQPDSENIIIWHHQILETYYSRNFGEEGSEERTVSLVGHGSYELRLVELPRKLHTETKRLWLELFDHDRQRTIDSYGGRTLEDITAAAESLCSNARELSRTD